VAIGMLTLYSGQLMFKYSNLKLHRLKGALGDNWAPISKSLQANQRYIENINIDKNPLFHEATHMFSANYLSKLSVYSNGLIQFQEPKMALLTSTFGIDDLYNSLFPGDHNDGKKVEKPKCRSYLDQHFISRLSDRVHVKVDIDDRFIPDFYLKYSIDAIGRNGILYLAQYIDFSIEQKASISHLLVTTDHLNKEYNKGKVSNVSIFGVEPTLGTDDHKKWEFLYKCQGFKLYHPDQADKVAEKFLTSGASKFLAGV
jgi:hypothetical protein